MKNNSIILISIQSSFSMSQLNTRLITHLRSLVDNQAIESLIRSFNKEQDNQHKKINTPATNCTNSSWRKDGNAIDKIRRKRKNNQEPVESLPQNKLNQFQGVDNEPTKNEQDVTPSKILQKNKAVYFGEDCELPYLHSSDAISHLYSRKSRQLNEKEEVLYNPPSTIDQSYMTSLKSLHIYHTGIESLRQMGTGWCNLKQISIIYGRLVDLSGLSSFSSLEYLFLAYNKISSLSDLMFHSSIRCVDLQCNKIQNLEEIQYLTTMDKLENINLNNNPLMKIKQNRRLVQQKLGKILQLEEYTRLQEYQYEENAKTHDLISYQNIQISNNLIRTCNQQLSKDQITFQNVYDSYEQTNIDKQKINLLQFLRYQKKTGQEMNNQYQEAQQTQNFEDQQIIFTPLIHFLPGQKYYTNIIKKYLQNKIYINMNTKNKQSKSQSPAHNMNIASQGRLNKFASSLKLEKEGDAYSLDKKQCMTTDLGSIDKKRNRLSLGRTRKLLQKFDKTTTNTSHTSTQQLAFTPNFTSTINSNPSKTFTLKRTTLSRKPSIPDIELQSQKRFSKTSNFKCD